jgi:mycothiol maleylpyruvate isomerase-like protein
MGPDAAELIKELRASHERVAGLVARLGAEELRRPSYDDEWAVSQLLSHLGSGAEITLRRMEAAISGSPRLEQDDFHAIWDRWDSLEPLPVAAAMIEANEACVRRFETLDAATLRDLRLPFFRGGEIDVRGSVAMRLNEHALHAWDAAVAFDPAATIAPGSVEPLLWNLIDQEWIVARSADAEAIAGLAAKLGDRPLPLRTTDPEWWLALDLAGGQPHLRRVDAGGEPGVTIPAEAFVRMVYGRLDPSHTPARIEVAKPLTIEELRSAFKGY